VQFREGHLCCSPSTEPDIIIIIIITIVVVIITEANRIASIVVVRE